MQHGPGFSVCWRLRAGPVPSGSGLLPGRRAPSFSNTAEEFRPCSVKSPEKPQMLARVLMVCIVLSVPEWLRSCCKLGFCCQRSPSFHGNW